MSMAIEEKYMYRAYSARPNCKMVSRKPSHRVKFESRTLESESKSES